MNRSRSRRRCPFASHRARTASARSANQRHAEARYAGTLRGRGSIARRLVAQPRRSGNSFNRIIWKSPPTPSPTQAARVGPDHQRSEHSPQFDETPRLRDGEAARLCRHRQRHERQGPRRTACALPPGDDPPHRWQDGTATFRYLRGLGVFNTDMRCGRGVRMYP